MAEGSLYDRELAALAIKQARGDLIEAIFLVRAFRTTLPRFGATEPIDTGAMAGRAGGSRRPSRTCPAARCSARPSTTPIACSTPRSPRAFVAGAASDGRGVAGGDAARHRPPRPRRPDRAVAAGRRGRRRSATSPASRSTFPPTATCACRTLARGDEGFLLALGYSTQRGYGRNHPFAGEIRIGEVEVEFVSPRMLGFAVPLGAIELTECQMVNQFKGSATEAPPQFTRGYGLVFGQSERKAMSMALVDRALRAREFGEEVVRAGAGRGIRDLAFRQCPGDRLRRAPEAAALCRLPGRARPAPQLRAEFAEARRRRREPMQEAAE